MREVDLFEYFIGLTGSIIAAHCLFNRPEKRWSYNSEINVTKSNFRDPNWQTNADVIPSQGFYPHRYFDTRLLRQFKSVDLPSTYDIALIKLGRNFDFKNKETKKLTVCEEQVISSFFVSLRLGPVHCALNRT